MRLEGWVYWGDGAPVELSFGPVGWRDGGRVMRLRGTRSWQTASAITQLVECLGFDSLCHIHWAWCRSSHPSTRKLEGEGSEVQDYPPLLSKFETSFGSTGLFLKQVSGRGIFPLKLTFP
ncbi:hypothetical protein ACRRTK_008218 [Alexandromys fortis]